MTNADSLIEQIYQGILKDLSTGVVLPGQRVNVTTYCERFRASKSPVRNALYRLVGEGLLEAHLHDGFYRVRLLEKTLCDLLIWSEHALDLAFDLVESRDDVSRRIPLSGVDVNRVRATEVLFCAIADLGGNTACSREVDKLNDLLRPIRIQENAQWSDLDVELNGLSIAFATEDFVQLRNGIHAYHARRIDAVRQLVALSYQGPPR